jgi:ATP-dependent phosphofructokinase / diphosphate-dependent phosphofructokinase
MGNQLCGNALIGQSGGPTTVINASLSGVIEASARRRQITKVLGMRWGIQGFMDGLTVNLSRQKPETVKALRRTPSSALGSCRHKVQESDFPKILKMLKKHDIRYLFLIGGNDTMDTIHRVEEYCANEGYDLRGIGIPKTVDNDLFGTDHTPGYGSAARFVALSVLQSGILARDMQRVDQFVVHQTVGRDAGWLAAASALAKTSPDSAPHIILVPEISFERKAFLAEVKRIQKKHGFVYIVAGEGVRHADGSPVSAAKARDRFQNIEFGAMGGASVAMQIHQIIHQEFGWRGEFQVTESLPMCAADRASPTDIREAAACGRKAVQLAASGKSGVMVSIARKKGKEYGVRYETAPLSQVAVRAKEMPRNLMNKGGMYVTKRFLDYARPLAGPMPEYGKLDFSSK